MTPLRVILRALAFLFTASALLSLTSPESIWNGMLLFSILLAVPALLLYRAAELPQPRLLVLCRSCGGEGRPRRAYRGSFYVELGLWLLLFLPGLVYTVWRVLRRSELRCSKCSSSDLGEPAGALEPPGERAG